MGGFKTIQWTWVLLKLLGMFIYLIKYQTFFYNVIVICLLVCFRCSMWILKSVLQYKCDKTTALKASEYYKYALFIFYAELWECQ
jgi:hypothetical protein